jgi:hypothetical protein
MKENPFKISMRVRAKVVVHDWHTERTMQPGQTGEVIMTYPYTVQVRPDGKKLTIETPYLESFEEIK